MRKPKTFLSRLLRALLCVGIALGVAAGGIAAFALLGKERTLHAPLTVVTAQNLPDGVYAGAYRAFRFSNGVAVAVQDGRITDIRQVSTQVVAKPETIVLLTQRVLAAQSTQVDAVSGCTVDSKAFLLAVEDALTP